MGCITGLFHLLLPNGSRRRRLTLLEGPILSPCTDKESEAQEGTRLAQDHIASTWQKNVPLNSDPKREPGWPKSQGQPPCPPSLFLEDGYSSPTNTHISTMQGSTWSFLTPEKGPPGPSMGWDSRNQRFQNNPLTTLFSQGYFVFLVHGQKSPRNWLGWPRLQAGLEGYFAVYAGGWVLGPC